MPLTTSSNKKTRTSKDYRLYSKMHRLLLYGKKVLYGQVMFPFNTAVDAPAIAVREDKETQRNTQWNCSKARKRNSEWKGRLKLSNQIQLGHVIGES